MKTKYALLILAVGIFLDWLGDMVRITGFPGAVFWMFASFARAIGCLLLFYKAIRYPAFKDFLNS